MSSWTHRELIRVVTWGTILAVFVSPKDVLQQIVHVLEMDFSRVTSDVQLLQGPAKR